MPKPIEIIDGKKKCTRCGEWLHLDEYHKHIRKNGSIHRRNHCRKCYNAISRKKYAENKKKKELATDPNGTIKSVWHYEIISGGGCFRGMIPVTGFKETVLAGYFPSGMVVRYERTGQKYKIEGKKMIKMEGSK